MRDIIARVAAGTTTVEDAHELEKVLEGVDMRDIIARVAAGTTTVEDAHELEKVLEQDEIWMRRFYGCS